MTVQTYQLPDVPRVTIERDRRQVKLVRVVSDKRSGGTREIGFKMFTAAEVLDIGYALLRVAEDIQNEDREKLDDAQRRFRRGDRR